MRIAAVVILAIALAARCATAAAAVVILAIALTVMCATAAAVVIIVGSLHAGIRVLRICTLRSR